MKKFVTLICMIACILGLTACGEEESLSAYEQEKLNHAEQVAVARVLPFFAAYMDDDMAASLDIYTLDEITYIMGSEEQMNITGYVVKSAVESFHSAKETTGNITDYGEITAEIKGDTIVVEAVMKGEKKDAVAEVIFSNDMFMDVESVSLNPVSTMGELMTKAALNTVIGMGTVFAVLILICLIISCFSFIPKLQAKLAKKPAETVVESTGRDCGRDGRPGVGSGHCSGSSGMPGRGFHGRICSAFHPQKSVREKDKPADEAVNPSFWIRAGEFGSFPRESRIRSSFPNIYAAGWGSISGSTGIPET